MREIEVKKKICPNYMEVLGEEEILLLLNLNLSIRLG
jgi:hypothetical protein